MDYTDHKIVEQIVNEDDYAVLNFVTSEIIFRKM